MKREAVSPINYISSVLEGTSNSLPQIEAVRRLGEVPMWVNDVAHFTAVKFASGYEFLLAEPRTESSAERLLMLYRLVQSAIKLPLVLVTDLQSPHVRTALMRARIGMVRTGKMLFAPSLGIHFKDSISDVPSGKRQRPTTDATSLLSPREQLVISAVILNSNLRKQTSLKSFADEFTRQVMANLSEDVVSYQRVMAPLSFALSQLQLKKLVKLERFGKVLHIEFVERTILWPRLCRYAGPLIAHRYPVYSTVKGLTENNPKSSLTALSEYSNLLPPKEPTIAMSRLSWHQWNAKQTEMIHGDVPQAFVEVWRTDPRQLQSKDTVNPIFIALNSRRDADERVRIAVKEMLDKFELNSEPLWSI